VAATTIGAQAHLLRAGEGPAFILGALITIAASALAASLIARGEPSRAEPRHARAVRPGV
jgi:hypothetical protein